MAQVKLSQARTVSAGKRRADDPRSIHVEPATHERRFASLVAGRYARYRNGTVVMASQVAARTTRDRHVFGRFWDGLLHCNNSDRSASSVRRSESRCGRSSGPVDGVEPSSHGAADTDICKKALHTTAGTLKVI